MGFKPGNQLSKGKGRPAVILPEVKKAMDEGRNQVKVLVLKLLGMNEHEYQEMSRGSVSKMERAFIQCIDRIENDGDVQKLRMLLEISLGRMPDAGDPEELTPDEKFLLSTYRERRGPLKTE